MNVINGLTIGFIVGLLVHNGVILQDDLNNLLLVVIGGGLVASAIQNYFDGV